MQCTVIGIAGGTGSGKSTFTNRLKDALGDNIAVLYHDNYYNAQDDIPFEERKKVNYDSPDSHLYHTDRHCPFYGKAADRGIRTIGTGPIPHHRRPGSGAHAGLRYPAAHGDHPHFNAAMPICHLICSDGEKYPFSSFAMQPPQHRHSGWKSFAQRDGEKPLYHR